MKISKAWDFDDSQFLTAGSKKYNVHAAITLSKKIKVKRLLIADFMVDYKSPCKDSLMDFVRHMKMVNDADLKYPIILNEDGVIIDGRHRLAKAILSGHKYIKTKRFIKDPPGCFEWV